MEELKEMFLGKEVQIYPTDTDSKWGKVLLMSEVGVVFEITRSREHDPAFTVGSKYFIAWDKLSFKTLI